MSARLTAIGDEWRAFAASAAAIIKGRHKSQTPYLDLAQRLSDIGTLVELMREVTGHEPKMWGASIIGFGSYHYKSDRSRQEGDWPLVGFSPRKAAISLYVSTGADAQAELLKDLGKFKMGKACIYVKRLSDINLDVLRELIKDTMQFLQSKYGR